MAVEIGWGYPSKVEKTKTKKGKPQTKKEEAKPKK